MPARFILRRPSLEKQRLGCMFELLRASGGGPLKAAQIATAVEGFAVVSYETIPELRLIEAEMPHFGLVRLTYELPDADVRREGI